MTGETYIADQTYNAAVTALAALLRSGEPFDLENEIKIVLGEKGNIWPESIRRDAILSGVR